MKVWTHTGFKGIWPVGTAAVVVAKDRLEAASVLEAELADINMSQTIDPTAFEEVNTKVPGAIILNDGNY